MDLSLRYLVHNGTIVICTPLSKARPDAVDRFFELEFEDEDDNQPPQQAAFDADVDTVASNLGKEEASASASYKYERNVVAMDIVDRARLSLEAHNASTPNANDQAPPADKQKPPEDVPPAQQGGDRL